METIEIVEDLRLKHNGTMIISGPTQSGKSTFIKRLIRARGFIFDLPLDRVYWYYGIVQPELHTELRSMGVRLEEGLPSDNFSSVLEYSMIVLDDLSAKLKSNKIATELFTQVAHHKHCFIIMVNQNAFEQGTESRTQQLNAMYRVLFKNPSDKLQVQILSNRMFPGKNNFLSKVFEAATKRVHGYLFIDNHQRCPEHLRLRTNILPDEIPMYAFQEK